MISALKTIDITAARPALPVAGSLALEKRRIHEAQGIAADSLAAAIISASQGPVVWIGSDTELASLNPRAAAPYFDPSRLILTIANSRKDVLWAAEQALRCESLGCTIIQLRDGPDLFESRRLQLAAEDGGHMGLILIERRAHTSACQTRWLCEPRVDAAGADGWQWHCTKNKTGHLGRWHIDRKGGGDAAMSFRMVSAPGA